MDDIFNHHFMGWNKITPNIFGTKLFLIKKKKKKKKSYHILPTKIKVVV